MFSFYVSRQGHVEDHAGGPPTWWTPHLHHVTGREHSPRAETASRRWHWPRRASVQVRSDRGRAAAGSSTTTAPPCARSDSRASAMNRSRAALACFTASAASSNGANASTRPTTSPSESTRSRALMESAPSLINVISARCTSRTESCWSPLSTASTKIERAVSSSTGRTPLSGVRRTVV